MAPRDTFSAHEIPKLEGSTNYKQWSILCRASLKSSAVWRFIEAVVPLPVLHPDERDYQFQERLDVHLSRVELARNIILFSCKPHIQLTLENVVTPAACWEKLSSAYASEGLIYVHDVYMEFDRCSYNPGDNIETFCGEYQAILDRCKSVDIIIQPKIQVIKFIGILDAHFEHWCANKREGLRRNADLPSLDSLISEVCDEHKRKKQRVTLQAQAAIPVRSSAALSTEPCTSCGLPRHRADRCWYKFPHLLSGFTVSGKIRCSRRSIIFHCALL